MKTGGKIANRKWITMETDSPWKEAIETFFPEFLRLLFRQIHDAVDWSKGYRFMDKELERIVRDADSGLRVADKLIRVFLLNGEEKWIMIHIEVQGYPEKAFEFRMFQYHYRLMDKYGADIVSLGVLVDDNPGYRPSIYRKELFGCEVVFKFPSVKILDFTDKWDALQESGNPFAIVIMAHLKTQETVKKAPGEGKQWKFTLIRMLYKTGYEKKEVLELFRFIDWIMKLPDELEQELMEELVRIEEDEKMAYVTSVERIAMKKGIEQGIQQGMQQGMQQGIQKGMQQGERPGMGGKSAEGCFVRRTGFMG